MKELQEYVCWLSPAGPINLSRYNMARSQTIWATDPADAENRLQSWKDRGYNVKCVYSMDEFKRRMAEHDAFEQLLRETAKKNEYNIVKAIEVENV